MDWRKDKVLHFLVGVGIAIITWGFVGSVGAITLATITAIAKEVYDYWDYGKADPWDALSTMGGCALMLLVLEGIKWSGV